MKVLKFGGSSLGTPEIIKEVKDIVEGQQQGTIVVVSAFKGVTDQLLQAAEQARSRDKDYIKQIDNIRVRHEQAVKQLIPAKIQQDSVIRKVNDICNELSEICNGIFYLKDITPKVLDMVVSFGERLSAYIVSEIINDAFYSDARKFIKTDSCFG